LGHTPAPDRQPLFHLEGLGYRYPDATEALQDISLEIRAGDRIALVGQNGSGKTTLAKHLNGLCRVQQGKIAFRGQELTESILADLRLRIGILFQDPDDHLFCSTLYEDLAFGPMNQGLDRESVDQRVREAVAAVDLARYLFKPAHLLSYGQKKRAALAAVLAMKPEMLILDEPTVNLDPRQEKLFQQLLKDYPGTLLIIGHDLLFLYDLCDRAVVLANGRVRHDCRLDDLVSHRDSLRQHGLDFTFRFSCCAGPPPEGAHQHHHQTHDHAGGAAGHCGSAPEEPLIELQHYSFRYPDGTSGLDDVSLLVRPGETIALIGENGAGKSTLAGCLLGIHCGAGFHFFDGMAVTAASRKMLWQRMGMVFQNAADQLFCPSCREEAAFGPRQMGIKGRELEERVRQALAAVGLAGYEERVPLNMSGGERKRLAIASVLSMEPDILILDEPTAGLDPQGEEMLMTIMQRLAMTKIFITHDFFFINECSNRTVVMHQGRIIRDYATRDFLADSHLRSINNLDYTYKNDCVRRLLAGC